MMKGKTYYSRHVLHAVSIFRHSYFPNFKNAPVAKFFCARTEPAGERETIKPDWMIQQ